MWLAAAAAVGLALAAWQYALREEPVPGRTGPAALRGLAVFLFLSGLLLPSPESPGSDSRGPVVLLDVSASMGLPSAPRAEPPGAAAPPADTSGPEVPASVEAGAATRLDSARVLVRSMSPSRVWLFGGAPAAVDPEDALRAAADAGSSRLLPALEAAGTAGAAEVVVVTDGWWADRSTAERRARAEGPGLREVRVAAQPRRLGIASVEAPVRVRAGDTLRVAVEIRAGGGPEDAEPADGGPADGGTADGAPGAVDSVTVELREGDRTVASGRAAAPPPGRAVRAELAYAPGPEPATGAAPTRPGDTAAEGRGDWRRLEVRLPPGADPYRASDRWPLWVEIDPEAAGVVVISTEPDWEARYLVPVLERVAGEEARAFVRAGEDRWLEVAPRPRPVAAGRVRAAATGARLLVVQADPGAVPGWLGESLRRHPRTLFLARGAGPVPGSGFRVAAALQGEWYPAAPVPPGPAAGLVPEEALEEMPPLERLHAVEGPADWTALEARRDRRGESRPFAVGAASGATRRAVVAGEGAWRWAARPGSPRRVYEGWVSGVAGWLLEEAAGRPVDLDGRPVAGEPLAWRVAPGVSGLELTVLGADGDTSWTSSAEEPPPLLEGPALPAGERVFVARGSLDGEAFRLERPFRLEEDPAERIPRALPAPLRVEPRPTAGEDDGGSLPGGTRPAWPFVAAALLLCAEWAWRRRLGLR